MRPDLYSDLAEVEDTHWWFRARRSIVLGLLSGVHGGDPRETRILDVGAGTGSTTVALGTLGRVDALEAAPEALEHLRRRPGVTVIEGLLPNPELGAAHYHIVTALDVLEHVGDDRGAARDLARTLVPGGHLLVTVPAHPWLWSDFDEACHHVRRYRPGQVASLLRDVGLEPVFSSPFQTLLFLPFVAERLLRRVAPRGDALSVPPRPVNRFLEAVFSLELTWLARGWAAPLGASQVVLARKPA